MIPNKCKGRFAYHFTSVYNFEDIIANGLLSTNLKNSLNITHDDIANGSIQQRRSTMAVTCGKRGVVHDYVPFYFAKRTPMLLNIVKSKNFDQIDIMYLAIPIEKVIDDDVVFSRSSANTNPPPTFYNKPEDLNNLDWDAIDSYKWTYPNDDDRHNKMAEMLIYGKVNINEFSHIVVWNEKFKKHIEEILTKNNIDSLPVVTDYEKHFKHHYFTIFDKKERTNIITGPRQLYLLTKKNINQTIENQKKDCHHTNLKSLVDAIEKNFSCIKELEDIDGLETDNIIHKECVGTHSRSVAALVKQDSMFNEYNENEKLILILSAYLHDIGKGPKSRWETGIQKVDEDHPRKSLPMLKRILCDEISGLSKSDIRRIHMLVIYDDLVGDILAKCRKKCQLEQIIRNRTDVNLLISIAKADMGAINPDWVIKYQDEIEDLRQEMYKYLEDDL